MYREARKSQKVCTMTGKKRAIPSLHRDSFLAKVTGLCPDAASGNATSLYCRAVSVNNCCCLALIMCDLYFNRLLRPVCEFIVIAVNMLTVANSPAHRKLSLYRGIVPTLIPGLKYCCHLTGLLLRAFAYGNSRFCFLKFTKPVDEHHLQTLAAASANLHLYSWTDSQILKITEH